MLDFLRMLALGREEGGGRNLHVDNDTVKQCAVAGLSQAQGTQMLATAHRQYFDSEQVYD